MRAILLMGRRRESNANCNKIVVCKGTGFDHTASCRVVVAVGGIVGDTLAVVMMATNDGNSASAWACV